LEQFDVLRRFFHRLKPKARRMVEQMITHVVANELQHLTEIHEGKSLAEVDPALLEKLRRLYRLLDQHEELFIIESALKEK
jgi:hypothetical protein